MVTIPEEVVKEIKAFDREIKRLLNNEIPEEKFKKFRLQQGIYGQRQKGVQMVRVKIPSGLLNAEKLRTLADLVETYSTGKGHVTTRQDIQFHFVKLSNVPTILRRLAEAGLTSREACGNTVRNVTSCHWAGSCPTELFDVTPMSETVAYHLLRNPINQDLPRKFKISFSGCKSECGLAAIHDIGFIAESRNQNGTTEYGFRVYAGGGLGSSPKLAKLYSEFLPFEEVLPTCEAMLKIFDANGDRKTRSKARMKFILEKWGMAKFKEAVAKEIAIFKEVKKAYPPLRGAANGALPMVGMEQASSSLQALLYPSVPSEWIKTNVLPTKNKSKVAVQVRLPLGDITAEALRGLADIVDQFAPQALRATHQQNFVLFGIDPSSLPNLYRALNKLGLAASGAETAVDVIACPGADSCQLALTSSMGVGAAISDAFAQAKTESDDLAGLRIRISGCPNSCAQHHIAGIGLHGVAKKINGKLVPHYQVHLGGGVNADSSALGKPTIKIPAKNIPQAVMKISSIFRENHQNGERFNDFIKRYGANTIATQLTDFTNLPMPDVAPESYKDYKAEGDFHLDDLGPGECAGGVIDLIENLLRTSRQSLADAQLEVGRGREDLVIDPLKSSILRACRALLIPFGVDSPDDNEILKQFQHKVVEQGIVSERFETFTQSLGQWIDFDSVVDLEAHLDLSNLFLAECQEAYDQMDASMKLKKLAPGSGFQSQPQPANTNRRAKNEAYHINMRLDLSGVACPMNFVKTKLQLEEMEAGQVLAVIIDDGAPKDNVPRSVQAEGHKILKLEQCPDSHYELVIEKV
ncbi:MAG: sulfurtransferase TusA family protein [Nitrospirota bacterium]